ncbi:MAG TPA: hypothetical protein EYG68_02930 [Leucothrix mucor]|nr:hypothetical protein [Leucothrix mucor]
MKYQWFKVDWDLEYKELKKLLLSSPYTETSGKGFVLDEAYVGKTLSGRYIQKNIVWRESSSPYGKIEKSKEVIYITYQFQIDMDNQPSLRLTNPPRSGRIFSTALAIVTHHRVAIHQDKVDLFVAINELKKWLPHFSLLRIDANQIPFTKGASATIILRGKDSLLDAMKQLPQHDKGQLTKIEFTFRSELGEHKILMNNRGRVEIVDERIAHTIYPKLYNIVSKLI